MNILYLGQYRDVSINGLHSEAILNSLSNLGNVTSRHILSDSCKTYNNRIVFSENKTNEEYDVLIQHLPINSLCYTQKIKRNIAIPILGSELLSEDDIGYLNLFDEVLVDEPLAKQTLDIVLNKPSKPYNLKYQDLIKKTDQIISFPSHNQMKKFYAIMDYDHNNEHIFDLISEFIPATLNQENICLVLYLINSNSTHINQIQEHILGIQKICNINKENLAKIIVAPIPTTYSDLCLAHKAGDVFLDLQDYPKNSLNSYVASTYGNLIFSQSDSNTQFTNIRDGAFSLNGHIVFDKAFLKNITTGQVEATNNTFTNNYLEDIL
jgi:hypothetical protein